MEVKINTQLDMRPVANVLNEHGLSTGGRVQRYITANLIKTFDGYVPLRSGILKGSVTRNNAAPYEQIVYDGPYAARLYYNPQYNFNEAPKRGGYWASRAWADNKDGFLFNLQNYIREG